MLNLVLFLLDLQKLCKAASQKICLPPPPPQFAQIGLVEGVKRFRVEWTVKCEKI